ncbi:hypothetical protein UlMin_002551 [Ulmus minor]
MLNRWRELTKTFRNRVDPEKTEQLKRTKAEIEKNVTSILKLIKNDNQGKKDGKRKASKKETELLGLVENFYKEYQSLYTLYDHLIGGSGKAVRGRKKESFYDSSSDSEYFSSEEIDFNYGKLEHEHHNRGGKLKQELEVADLKQNLASVRKENEALRSEYKAALSKAQQAEATFKDMRIEADQRERDLSALVKMHEARGIQSLARIKELESQLASLKIEMESSCSQNRELESRKEGKAVEVTQPGDKRKGGHSRVLELELILKDKENENSALLNKLKEDENNSTSKIVELMAKASNLQLEVDLLRAQKGELEERLACEREDASAQVKELMDQINVKQQEIETLHCQKNELELQLEKKSTEISHNSIQTGSQEEELTKETLVEKKMLEDGQCFEEDREASMQIMVSTAQINNLKQELDSLRQLELQNERENQEHFESLTQMGDGVNKLTDKMGDQQIVLKDQGDASRQNSRKGYKKRKGVFQESKPKLQVLEKKMEELAEKFQATFEDKIRLLYQRILIAEELHTEHKESFNATKERYEKENQALEEKIATYEAELLKMRDISAFTGLDMVVSKFEEDNGKFLRHFSEASEELRFAKKWITEATSEIKRLKQKVDCMVALLDDKEEQEVLLRDKVWRLEAIISREGGEKLNLVQAIAQLENKVGKYEKLIKDKDEMLVSLGDEKREAIKQLCVLIEYHRSRCDDLKQLVSNMSLRCLTS